MTVGGGDPAHLRAPEIDGLRAVAVASVVLYHVLLAGRSDWAGFSWVVQTDFGVMIFFILSGYLIYGPFARAHLAQAPFPALGRYLLRRGTRIFPAYWVALLVLLAVGWIHISGDRMLYHLTLTDSYVGFPALVFGGVDGLGPSWTLVIEVTFYAFVPVWAFLVRRLSAGRAPFAVEVVGVSMLMVVGAAVVVHDSYKVAPSPSWVTVLPLYLTPLGLGMLLAVLDAGRRDRPWLAQLSERMPPVGVWWIAAIGAFVTLAFSAGGVTFRPRRIVADLGLSVLVAALVAVPVILGTRRDSSPLAAWPRRLLSLGPVRWLGVVSYGVYLWHVSILEHLPGAWSENSLLGNVAQLAFGLGLIFALGTASFYLLERPLLERVGRSSSRRAAVPVIHVLDPETAATAATAATETVDS